MAETLKEKKLHQCSTHRVVDDLFFARKLWMVLDTLGIKLMNVLPGDWRLRPEDNVPGRSAWTGVKCIARLTV